MLGKFLGGAMQHTKGSFIEGEVYVITAYNPADDTVQTTGNTTRNRWVDADAFEVTRNTAWSFRHGHLSGMEGIIGDIAKFEDRGHDDHIEALSFDPRVIGATPFSRAWMGIDLANSPDYSASGRYIGKSWPEMTSRMLRPARPLAADENQHKIISHDFTSLEQKAMTYARKGKSRANDIFIQHMTSNAEFIGREHQARRFAMLDIKEHGASQEPSLTDDICDAFLAVQRLMQVPDRLLVEKPTLTADAMHQMQFNCRCVMPDITKGAFIVDEQYIASIEDGKPTYSKPFLIKGVDMSAKFEKTMRARLERSMNGVHLHMSATAPELYNRMVECERDIGAFVKGCTYRAVVSGIGPGIKVEHPNTSVPMPVPRDYFKTVSNIPCAVDDRDAPFDPDFEGDIAGYQQIELPEESTFVHKSATRKTQEIHEENDGTADLRKYRFNPEA
jgi:hypothetical protein